MNRVSVIIYFFVGIIITFFNDAYAQEAVAPVNYNPFLSVHHAKTRRSARTTATVPLTLPFFESFTGYWIYPDSNKWVDDEVYVNNTMCASPIDRGCATFDNLNSIGMPYDSFSNTAQNYADSLTSQPIDISSYGPGDSLYLSFFYQPQGYGFYPLTGDSLMLFLKDEYGGFVKVWSIDGGLVSQPFQQVMIPITDSIFFDTAFQFRFVNIASLDWSDAIWNLDYIRLNINRTAGDTTIPDVAISTNPTFLLNDYSYMPYNQFLANPMGEMASQVSDTIRNDTSYSQGINYAMSVTDEGSGSVLENGSSAVFLPGYQSAQVTEPLSAPTSWPTYAPGTKVDFGIEYYLQNTPSTGITANDTIVKDQVFDNYLAYDDGTAEKSYYLILSPTEDGRIAIEYHLNTPDTMRGLAIYFGRQIPYPTYKAINIFVWTALKGINGAPADVAIDSIEFCTPFYADTENHFWIYTFSNPLVLQPGIFYAGTQQPAESGDDSVYFGLDVNRVGSNHAYYNVNNEWQVSQISGAIMMRPILGHYVFASGISDVPVEKKQWQVMPNPAKDMLQFEFESNNGAAYSIINIQGNTMLRGTVFSGKTIDISGLPPGLYFVNIVTDGIASSPQKIIKL